MATGKLSVNGSLLADLRSSLQLRLWIGGHPASAHIHSSDPNELSQ